MLHQKLFQPNMWLLCKTARVKLHFCTCVFTKYVVFDQPSHHIRFGGNLSKTNCACMINFLYKIIHEPWLRGGAGKVEKILKGSLDSIPFDENSNYGWESLRFKSKTLLGLCQQTFESKNIVDIIHQWFAFLHQVNLLANNLNFHWRWRWWDRIQTIFLNLFYFTKLGWLF